MRTAIRVLRGFPPEGKRSAPLLWPTFRGGVPQWHIVDVSAYINEGFNLNALVYSAVMFKARSLGSVPLRAYIGDVDAPEVLPPNHPLAQLCKRPNPWQNWREFQMLNTIFLNIAGDCYVIVGRRGRNGLPERLFPVRPDRMYIVPSKSGDSVDGYIYAPEGTAPADGIPYLPQDVMHVKFPNPGDALGGFGEGLSPLSAAAQSADVDNDVTAFLHLFFERGVVVPGVLSFDGIVDDNDLAEVRERFSEQHGGYERWDRPAIFDKSASYQRIGLTFNEMGFEGIDDRDEARVLGPFGVPPVLLGTRMGIKHSIYNNYAEARRACWDDTLEPELRLFEDEYQYYLQTDDGAFVRFDLSGVPAYQRDIPALTTAAHTLWTMGVPADVAFTTVGLSIPPLPGGNVGYIPLGVLPVGSPASPDSTSAAGDIPEATEQAEDEEKRGPSPAEDKRFAPEARKAVARRVDRIAQKWQERFRQGAMTALENDRRAVLAVLDEAQKSARRRKATVSWQEIAQGWERYFEEAGPDNWRSVFVPLVMGVVDDQGEAWAAQLGMEWDVRNLAAEGWFDTYALRFSRPILRTSSEQLSVVLQQGMRDGWSIPQMMRNIDALFRQWMTGGVSPDELSWIEERLPQYRLEMIARTETIRASNAGTTEIFRDWGIAKREWLTAHDDRVRSHANGDAFDHTAADGEVRPFGEPFRNTGEPLEFPGDPNGSLANTINCRCTILPVIED